MSPDLIFELQDQVWQDWRNLPPTEPNLARSVSAIRRMSIKTVIVTSRPTRLVSFVKDWLADHRIVYDAFHAIGPGRTKASVYADALVDDAPEMIQSFIKANRVGLLYSQPWNRDCEIVGALVVRNFQDVIRVLMQSRIVR